MAGCGGPSVSHALMAHLGSPWVFESANFQASRQQFNNNLMTLLFFFKDFLQFTEQDKLEQRADLPCFLMERMFFSWAARSKSTGVGEVWGAGGGIKDHLGRRRGREGDTHSRRQKEWEKSRYAKKCLS